MRIVVTGAGGFVGRKLVKGLAAHDVVALDNVPGTIPDLPNVTAVIGDLCDTEVLTTALAEGCDAVIHLATVPGGAAEQDPELARRVNVEATMKLAEAATQAGQRPRFVFASSIAVFGGDLTASVDHTTSLSPQLLYGGHKAMMEQWLATLSRRGAIDAVSLRLSGVVARPKGPSGMKSAFMSDVFHALSAGDEFVMPVSATATSWLTSVECAVDNFARALTIDFAQASRDRAITLPALRVRMHDLVAEIGRQTGAAAELVSYAPDTALESAFGAFPPLSTPMADALGFVKDIDLPELVARTLSAMHGADEPAR